MARQFIVDGTSYPDPGPDVTPEQFKEMMAGFLPEMATAEMTEEKSGEDTVYRFRKRVGVKGLILSCPDCNAPITEITVERYQSRTFKVDHETKIITPLPQGWDDEGDLSYRCQNCDSLNLTYHLRDYTFSEG